MNKIDAAIHDTTLYLDNAKEQAKLTLKEIEVLESRLRSLEIIRDDDTVPHDDSLKPCKA